MIGEHNTEISAKLKEDKKVQKKYIKFICNLVSDGHYFP